jgi:hypothetical protein
VNKQQWAPGMITYLSGFMFVLTFGICIIEFISYWFGGIKPSGVMGAFMRGFLANYRLDRQGIK